MTNPAKNILTPHQKSALNYSSHISLTANAGSGKTFVLSRRYLEIAINEDLPLRNIAAITFTDKSAGELYKKIAFEIESRLLTETDNTVRKKLDKIRRQLVSANISTIHSFCIDILREYPVEASLDANFQSIDENLSNELVELSVEETIKSAFNDPGLTEDIKYLIRFFASGTKLSEELFSLIKNRKNVFDIAGEIYSKPEKEIAHHFYSKFTELAEIIFFNKKEILIQNLETINNFVLSGRKKNSAASEASVIIKELKEEQSTERLISKLIRISNLVCTQKGKLKAGYLDKQFRGQLSAAIEVVENFFEKIEIITVPENHPETEFELAVTGKKLIKLFNKCAGLYEEKKKENGFLDFEDILLRTRYILKNENVRKALSEKYKYILVDEYQDTNEIQYQIFLPILDYLKSGNLFVVGDEKQSIYMFRDAELEIFSETKRNIENVSGKDYILTLPDSFRMAPGICLFVNRLFKNLFDEPNELYNEVNYSELVCAREDGVKGKIEILIGNDEKPENSEPELIARRILKLINEEPIKWSEIAVLVRKRKNFSDLEKVFSKYKIPFNVVGGTGFYQKQSIYDIYNYFSFLLDKNNNTSLVGILRSPFFNLSDAQIFQISRIDGFTYWEKFRSYCGIHTGVNPVKEMLVENLILVKNIEPAILLRKIFNETPYLSVLASKSNGAQELANVEKLINLTTSFNRQPFRTVYDYVNFLKESIEKTEDESQAAVTEESDSVKIMTLHQAKGLEFRAVFLFKCDEVPPSGSVASKEITVAKKIGLLTKVPLNENYLGKYESPPITDIYNYIIKKKDLAEIKRLFYVGITRAMDYLFISAAFKENYKYNINSFMGLLKQGLNPDLDSDGLTINSDLKFLKRINNNFENITETLSLSVPIVKMIEETGNVENLIPKRISPEKFNIKEIKDLPEGEIISATKLSIFNQCPLKYCLTYEHGFTGLMNQFKDWKDRVRSLKHEFNPYEDHSDEEAGKDIPASAEIKGRVIHKILQEETDKTDIRKSVENFVRQETAVADLNEFNFGKLSDDITADLEKFYDSKTYNELSGFKKYYNEYEVYSVEKDYFLYGIIDRLIIDDKKAVIIDYKTDDIEKDEIKNRFESYLTQLKFYSYIVNRLFKDIEEFDLRIIFIRHPDEMMSIRISGEQTEEIRNTVEQMVAGTREGNFRKNLSHCSKCIFSLNHKNCIVSQESIKYL